MPDAAVESSAATTRRSLMQGTLAAMGAASLNAVGTAASPQTVAAAQTDATPTTGGPPNIVYVLVDNLGMGELGCYGGGVLRGANTARIDAFTKEGLQLLNFAPEAQCTPSRSALMKGRHAIRSGNHTVAL